MSSKDLGIYINQLLNKRDIKQTDLSKRIGISRQKLNDVIQGKVQEPKISTITAIARGLNVHPIALLRELLIDWEFPAYDYIGAKEPRDASGFIQDLTYPDNSCVAINKKFIKTWEIQNIGAQVWEGRSLVCVDGEFEVVPKNEKVRSPFANRGLIPTSRKIPIKKTLPLEIVSISVEFTAPAYPCSVYSYWKMVDKDGNLCFPETEGLSCLIKVVGI